MTAASHDDGHADAAGQQDDYRRGHKHPSLRAPPGAVCAPIGVHDGIRVRVLG
jgi:hypothetical protein